MKIIIFCIGITTTLVLLCVSIITAVFGFDTTAIAAFLAVLITIPLSYYLYILSDNWEHEESLESDTK